MLELASGNGSNSAPLLARSLRLVATDGAEAAVGLTRAALHEASRASRSVTAVATLPNALPRGPFDAAVIAEVLYYLSDRDVRRLGRELAGRLRPGGRLVLAHHHVDFDDTASLPKICHASLLGGLADAGRNALRRQTFGRTGAWRVERVDMA